MLLQGKKLIITAGVTGCGKAIAEGAAREGASVVTVSRALPTDERAVKVIETCRSLGAGSFKHIQLDVSDRDAVFQVFDEAVAFLGGLDCLVSSAAFESGCYSDAVNAAKLRQVFDVNVNGTIFANQAAFKHMRTKGGSIINLGSFAGINGVEGETAYSVSKGAVHTFSRLVAKEWGKYNIRVNVMLPVVATDFARQAYLNCDDEYRATLDALLNSTIFLGDKWGFDRHGDVNEAANAAIFLASDMSKYITGQIIGVDGGMFMGR
ncbi:3-oxoacyl-[acyl-carrier protein] reductase [Dehalobacter sp. UNSWDHB]|jgi:Dehydrogenases with different specificities (related to short-chain alcohol dehydrogenases)|uniref:SDR family NAD(P)-dependent oxidoreductase n=1 Tax=unclassified Dehalobacter TaxID=2635733 RepID=UPI00028B0322|nr:MULTISPECIES: SDR family oxidoreductase [unclassified Dehalobacter]AFV03257.1 3-oxoacyl-[acyl-carrier protein] reductase [Dehalobacter sp. DCA]AFV06243.1 3-oxoacyl-[acyl-carrier protein] reductase [Dehalobacter sp. CF]EQB21014.1 3-oxoacyl-[acyl-carrier protein] reductase [Dehalobacter sp. UNSWDHB]